MSCTRKLLVLSLYRRGEKEGDSALDIKVMTRMLCFAFLSQPVLLPDFLYSQSDFYRGKTLRIVRGHDERMEINFVRRYPFGIAQQMSVPEKNQKAIRELPRDDKAKTYCPRL